jgi:hypothetical protein
MAKQHSTQFYKVAFSHPEHGFTAGLIFDSQFYKVNSVSDISRYFPMYEARKMQTIHVSPAFDTWDEAFAHNFGGQTNA